MTNLQVLKEQIRSMFEDDEPCEEDKSYFKSNRIYRKWPFLAWLFMGIVTGSGLILLPSGLDSLHFIDPSAKMIIGMGLFMILSFKLFHKKLIKGIDFFKEFLI